MANRIVIDPVTRIEGHLRIEIEVKDGEDRRRLQLRHDGARLRDDPQGPRPARRLGLHRARLRRVHHGARAGVGAHRRGRARHHRPAQRRTDPQPDVLRAVPAGPRRPLLPPARARLGGRRQRAQGRSEEDVRAGAEHLRTGRRVRRLLLATSRSGLQDVRRERPARHLRQRLLGPSGLQAARRSEPDGRGALPRGARMAEGDRQGPHDLRRQEPASELPGRRRALLDQHRTKPTPSTPSASPTSGSSSTQAQQFVEQVYIPDLLAVASFYKDWARDWRRSDELSGVRRSPDERLSAIRRSFKFPRGAILEPQPRGGAAGRYPRHRPRSRSSSTTPGTPTRAATARACIRGTARRSSTTPGRSRRTSSSTSRRSTAG